MASETESPVSHPSRISGNMDFSDFPPFILGFTNAELGDRLILLSPLTGGVFVVEAGTGSDRSSSSSLDSLLAGILGKDGLPPASKASIEALRSVEIGEEEEEEGECAICLEEWGVGETVKEMPCRHRFHKECIEKWLGIHGSCPVCRHKMPEEDKVKQKSESSRWKGTGLHATLLQLPNANSI
ncbi:PREDICTED: E3 ubiquitin-protein ligase RING1-like [Ipomoea nil]|uniref:E3 ubiquitin-protein ligase RING1-like n=1 Tax=Ipomoea nil TaxID=35883 RepID=UPI000901F95B|nr:PREDICTED: E3 ubiquitin-protein ligase RING1-like [Ipomoea nil]